MCDFCQNFTLSITETKLAAEETESLYIKRQDSKVLPENK
jgi:hypothetical protein